MATNEGMSTTKVLRVMGYILLLGALMLGVNYLNTTGYSEMAPSDYKSPVPLDGVDRVNDNIVNNK